MAINQGKLMEILETLGNAPEPETFIYEFLAAYNTPKSTITRIKQGGDRNVGEREGDVGLRQKLYFRPVEKGDDLFSEADSLTRSEVISRNQVRFVIVTDYRDFVAYDLSANDRIECAIEDLYRHFSFFLPLVGYEKAVEHAESPTDVKAAEKMGRFCDLLRQNNDLSTLDKVHELNVFMMRVLFCLFAEDTNLFRANQFTAFVTSHTGSDVSDASPVIRQLFQTLNQQDRSESLSAALSAFPFVNGGLFREDLPVPEFTPRARRLLLDAASLDWSIINPDIFGSMFQAVIDPEQRGNLGQHYTSFNNIMKVLRPLFLDDLEQELQKATGNPKKLERLLQRIRDIRVFDPACGSGNFLIVAYKQLRKFEMRVLDALNERDPQGEMIMPGIHLSNFYGIEINDFAHETAQLSLWLAEHQMNQAFLDRFGHYEPTLPLKTGGNITLGNALRLDWNSVCPQNANSETYLCGTPPFRGHGRSDEEQIEEIRSVLPNEIRSYKSVDYAACWFSLAASYISGTENKAAFLDSSNNSTALIQCF